MLKHASKCKISWLGFILFMGCLFANLAAFAQPKIVSFTPLKGDVGASVVINGSNFSATPANNIVFFGATRATVTTASASQLTVTVPSGATYAPITVVNTTTGLWVAAANSFNPTYTPRKQAISGEDIAPKQDIITSSTPVSIAIGDLDGDGKSDLVILHSTDSLISILRNTGTSGTIAFAPKVDLKAETLPQSVVLADFDRDGKLDIAITNSVEGNVMLLKNNCTTGVINFTYGTWVNVASEPYGLAVADMDLDGKPDIVAANSSSNTVSVVRNTGTGGVFSFAAKQDFSTSSVSSAAPYALALGDLNGDGKPDIVVSNYYKANIAVIINGSTVGSLAFAPAIPYTTFTSPAGIALGDIDGDGLTDIAVAAGGSANVSVFRNLGSGTFASKADFPVGASPWAVTITDINADGKPDLCVANKLSNSISILRNTSTVGILSFAAKVDAATASQPYWIASGDLDGDGKPDIATANLASGSVSVLRNTPQISSNANLSGLSISAGPLNPAFAAATIAYATTYYNTQVLIQVTATAAQPDAILQIRVNGGGYSNLNSGSASFSLSLPLIINTVEVKVTAQNAVNTKTYTITVTKAIAPTITSFTPTSGVIGTPVTISGTNFFANPANNTVYFGATRANVTAATANSLTATVPVGASYAPISVLNVNGTNLSALSRNAFNPTFTPSKGYITKSDFSPKVDLNAGIYPRSVAIADIDGDGKADLAVANQNSNVLSVYRNISTSGSITAASFAAKIDFAIPGTMLNHVIAGDVDSDGKLDLIAIHRGSASVSILRNTSSPGNITSGSFAATVSFTTGTGPYEVAIGDLDGDGTLDLVTANTTGNTLSILRNTSTVGIVSFAPKVDMGVWPFPLNVVINDLDGDGRADIAAAFPDYNMISVYRNTGNIGEMNFGAPVNFATATGPTSLVAGDLDGDGKPDLAIGNESGNSISVLRNTGSPGSIVAGSFAAKQDFNLGVFPYTIKLGELDGDGRPEMIATSSFANEIYIFRNQSSPGSIVASSFAAPLTLGTGISPLAVAIGDFDGDGKSEICTANANSNSVSIFRNNPVFTSIVYVKKNATGNNTGTTWADAFTSVQDALSGNYPSVNKIWVAKGTYYPDDGVGKANNDRDASFTLRAGMSVYGGFEGTEPPGYDLLLRDFVTNETILSGDIDYDSDPMSVTGSGSTLAITGNAGNSYHVISNNGNGLFVADKLDGFTIKGGNANGTGAKSYGGGIYNFAVSYGINNCNFVGNKALSDGGAMFNPATNLSMSGCRFINNMAAFGGAIVTDAGLGQTANHTLVDCYFSGNVGVSTGGVIVHGYESSQGTALFDCTNCSFFNNYSYNGSNYGSAGVFFNQHIGFDGKFTNCLFNGNKGLGNDADEGGGALLVWKGMATVINSTFVNNQAGSKGGAIRIYLNDGKVVLKNSILWNNSAPEGNNIYTGAGGIFDLQNCLLSDASCPANSTCGTGMIYNSDPLFQDAANGNFRLQPCSPAIDASNDAANSTLTDLAASNRKVKLRANANTIDLGAYELATGLCCPAGNVLYVNATATGTKTGLSWANAFTKLGDAIAKASFCNQAISIWVAKGTYKPASTGNRDSSFTMRNNLAIYGGFAGTETTLSQRNWGVNPSILSGDIGTLNNISDNSYNVVRNDNNGLNATAILDGFTITGGNASIGDYVKARGGGVHNNNSSPAFNNCILIGNNATAYGGGMFNQNATAKIVNTVFAGNTALYGGGLYNESATPDIVNCTFAGNLVTNTGAAMYTYGAVSPKVTNTIMWGNSSGIQSAGGATPVITTSIVQSGTPYLNQDSIFIFKPTPGLGNIGDLRLRPCSPALNTGSNSALPGGTTLDLAGNSRIAFTTVDIGAYERQAAAVAGVYVDAAATGRNDGSTWANAYINVDNAMSDLNACANATATNIYLAKGTYTLLTNPTSITRLNAVILGGYQSGGGLIRDALVNPVIIKGDVRVLKSLQIDGVQVIKP